MSEARNIKLTLEYEGTEYHGWQSQRGRSSIQGELEQAIARVVNHPVTVFGSGRTDRGVHALGQVAHFRTTSHVSPPKVLLGVNTYLPEDIRIKAAEEVPAGFHARHSARGKRYRYTVLQSRVGTVLVRRFSTAVPQPLNVEAMRQGAAHLRGAHDFRAFEGSSKRRAPGPGEPPRSTVRTVSTVTVRECGPFVLIDAVGRGFLYGMVRTIAGTLLLVGQGQRAPEEVGVVLRSRDRREAGFTAPAKGLCLMSVYYEEDALERAVGALNGGQPEVDPTAEGHERFLKLFS